MLGAHDNVMLTPDIGLFLPTMPLPRSKGVYYSSIRVSEVIYPIKVSVIRFLHLGGYIVFVTKKGCSKCIHCNLRVTEVFEVFSNNIQAFFQTRDNS